MRKLKLNKMRRIINFLIGTSLFLTIWAKGDGAMGDFKVDNVLDEDFSFPSRISFRKLMEEERSLEIRKLLDMDSHGFIDKDINSLLDLLSTDELVDYHLDHDIRKENVDPTEKGSTDKSLTYYDEIGRNEYLENTQAKDYGSVEGTSKSSTIDEQEYYDYYYEEEFRQYDDLFKTIKISLNTNDQVKLSHSSDIKKEIKTSEVAKIDKVEETPSTENNEIPTQKKNSPCILCQVLQTPLLTSFNVSLEDAFNSPSNQIKQPIEIKTDSVESPSDDEENQNNSEEDTDTNRKLEVISIPTLITSSDFSDNFLDEETTESNEEAWQAWRGTQLHQHLLIQNERQESIPDQFENRSNETPRNLILNTEVNDPFSESFDHQDKINLETFEDESNTEKSSGEMWEAWRGQELHKQLLRNSDGQKSTIGPRKLDSLEITVVNNSKEGNTISDKETTLDCLTSFDKCLILNSDSRRPSLENKIETKNITSTVATLEDNQEVEGSGLTGSSAEIKGQNEGDFDPHNAEGDIHINENIVVIHPKQNEIKEVTSEKIFIVSPDMLVDKEDVKDLIKISNVPIATELPQNEILSEKTFLSDTTSEKLHSLSFDKEVNDDGDSGERDVLKAIETESETLLFRNLTLLPLPKITSEPTIHNNTSPKELSNKTKSTFNNILNGTENPQKIDLELQQETDGVISNFTGIVSKAITKQINNVVNIKSPNLLEITKITGGNFIKIEKEDIDENIPEELLEITTEEAFKFKTKSFNFEISDENDIPASINEPTEITMSFHPQPRNEILKSNSEVLVSAADLSKDFGNILSTLNTRVVQAEDSVKSNVEKFPNEIIDSTEKVSSNKDDTIIKEDVELASKVSTEESTSFVSTTTQKSSIIESKMQSEEKSISEIQISPSVETTEFPTPVKISDSSNPQISPDDSENTTEHRDQITSANVNNQVKESLSQTFVSSAPKHSIKLEPTTPDDNFSLKEPISSDEKKLSNNFININSSKQNIMSNETNSGETQSKQSKIEEEPRSQVTSKGKEPEWLENIQETAVPLLATWIVDYIKKDNSLKANTNDITQNLVNKAIIENLSQISPNFDADNDSENETPQVNVITGNLATSLASALANNSNTILYLFDDEKSSDSKNINNIFGENIDFTHPEIIISEEALNNTPIEAIATLKSIKRPIVTIPPEKSLSKRPIVTIPPEKSLSKVKSTETPTNQLNDSLNEINHEISNKKFLEPTRIPFTRPPLPTREPFILPTLNTRIPNKNKDKLLPNNDFASTTVVNLDPELYEVQESPERGNLLLDSINDNNIHDHNERFSTRKPQEQNRISIDNSKRNKDLIEILNNIRNFNKNRNKNISTIKPKNTPDKIIPPFGRPGLTILPPKKDESDGDNNNENQEDERKGNQESPPTIQKQGPEVTLPTNIRPTIPQSDVNNEISLEDINFNQISSTRNSITRSTRGPFRISTMPSTRAPITRPTLSSTRTPLKKDDNEGNNIINDRTDKKETPSRNIKERPEVTLPPIVKLPTNELDNRPAIHENDNKSEINLEAKNHNQTSSTITPITRSTRGPFTRPPLRQRPEVTLPPIIKLPTNQPNNRPTIRENDIKSDINLEANNHNQISSTITPITRSTRGPFSRPPLRQRPESENSNEINLDTFNPGQISSTETPITRPPLRSTRPPFRRSTRAPFTRPTLRSTRTPFTRPPLRTTETPFTRPPLKTRPPFTRPPIRQNPSTQGPFTITPIRQNNTIKSIQENRNRNRLNRLNDRQTSKPQATKLCGCKNHGDCLDDDTCFCSHGYDGPKCETSLRKGVVIGGLKEHALRADSELVGGISRRCTIPDYPLEFMAATGQTFNQTIVVCGGATSQAGEGLAATPICHSWTLSSPLFTRTFGQAQWSGEFNLTIPRAFAASVRIPHDYMMILGGVDHNNNTLDTIEVVNVGNKVSIPLGLKMPSPLAGHCAVQLNSTHTLVVGGASEGYVGFNGVPSLNAKTWLLSEKGWEELEPLAVARTSHSCSTYITATGDPEVLVTGGVGVSDAGTRTILNSVEIFSVAQGRWRRGPPLPLPQIGAGLVEMAGRPLLFGGRWQVGSKLQQAESVIHFQVGTNPLPWNPAQFKLKSPRDMGVTVTAPSYC